MTPAEWCRQWAAEARADAEREYADGDTEAAERSMWWFARFTTLAVDLEVRHLAGPIDAGQETPRWPDGIDPDPDRDAEILDTLATALRRRRP